MTSVFLHVGLPKSGTSYLQRLLLANKEALGQRAGLLFPGATWRAQVAAVRDVRGIGDAPGLQGAWQRLVDEVLAWPGDAVISMEWLAPAGPNQLERIVTSFAPREVEVVFTARDVGRNLPAAWQEFMQNEQFWTWEEFLAGVTAPDPRSTPPGRLFWKQQDLPELLGRWLTQVDLARTHVVTIPQSGAPRDLLWQRFAQVLGVDPALATTEGHNANESLGLESAELMRRLNEMARDAGVDKKTYTSAFKHRLSKQVLALRRQQESGLVLPAAHHAWAEAVARRQVQDVRALGVHVVGDLEELVPRFTAGAAAGGRQPGDVTDGELLRIALEALLEVTPAKRKGGSATSEDSLDTSSDE